MSEFKVGDRVELIEDRTFAKKGMRGTIIAMPAYRAGIAYAVRFDKKFVGGHTCSNNPKRIALCEDGFGYFIDSDEMKVIRQFPQIFITVKGNQTIAVMKEGKKEVKRGVAKCDPADTFDFEIGTEWAMSRLFGSVEKMLQKERLRRNMLKILAEVEEL